MAIQATISLSIIFMSVWMAGMTFLIKGHFNNNGLNPIEHPISAYCAMSKSMHDMRLMKIICAVGYIILLADYLVFFGNQNVLGDKCVIIGIVGIGLMPLFSFFSWILPLRVADPDLEAVQDSKQPPNSAQNASSLTQAPVSYNHNSQIVDILHWVFAILLYAAFIMMASTISSNFKTILPGTILASHTQALQIVGYVCITWPSGMMLLGRRFKVLGLFQRLFHLNQTIWFLYMAVLLTIASS